AVGSEYPDDFVTGIFSPVVKTLFGLPKEAVIALAVGFLRKEVAVGMLLPLKLTLKQLFIASVLLSISFPCIATFIVLLKELGMHSLLKATLIMISHYLIVGGFLNSCIIF
ncbi:MAG: ferrous iron transporter B, partial [Candidatus Omnitrophica bacterium]|nr:ferrous iron transporter B [Candidatus Omnitrophota bacterium]